MKTPTPELDKQHAVIESGASQTLTEFYDWLGENGYVLCKWVTTVEFSEDWDGYDRLLPTHLRPEQLFADFFGIDLNQIESERRAILEELRNA